MEQKTIVAGKKKIIVLQYGNTMPQCNSVMAAVHLRSWMYTLGLHRPYCNTKIIHYSRKHLERLMKLLSIVTKMENLDTAVLLTFKIIYKNKKKCGKQTCLQIIVLQ